MKKEYFIALLSCFLLSSCVSNKPYVTISALSSDKSVGKKYIIVPNDKSVWEKDQLVYTQLAKQAVESLSMQGFTLVDNKEQADQMVMLSYGRDGGVSTNRNVSIPQWGQTGIASSSTYGSANTNINTYGNYGTANTTYNSTTTYTPTYGVTGYQNVQVTDTFFTIGVSMQAVDIRDLLKNNKVTSLWMTRALATSSQQDSLSDFKGLIRIMSGYAGKTLNEDVHLYVDPKTGK